MNATNVLKNLGKALAAALLAGGCLLSHAQATKVTLRTDYKFNGYLAPFALAVANGYYKEAGLDVSIEQGQGSGTTIQTVAAGTDAFGLADSATVVLAVSAQNVGVKMLSVYTQAGIMGLIYHPDSDFKGDIAALKNKVVISSAGTADLRLLAPALATAKLTVDDVQLQLVDSNARVPLFLQTPGAFLTGFATGDLLRVRARLPKAQYVPYSKWGVVAYGTGLIATEKTIATKPEMVRKFVNASLKGWNAAAANPEAAVAASLKLYPDLSPELIREGLKTALAEQLHTPATTGHPIGWTAEPDWAAMLDMLKTTASIKPKPLSSYYDNSFITEAGK